MCINSTSNFVDMSQSMKEEQDFLNDFEVASDFNCHQDIDDKNIDYQDIEVTLMTKILNTVVDDRERATLDLQKPYSLQQGNSWGQTSQST